MNKRFGFWLAISLLAIAMLAVVGYYSYHAGMMHGIAESGKLTSGGNAPVVVWPRWGFGFGFFPFFPLFFFILLWVFLLRGLFWRRRWGAGCGYGSGSGVPPQFEEWHRRAHEQTGAPPAGGTSKG